MHRLQTRALRLLPPGNTPEDRDATASEHEPAHHPMREIFMTKEFPHITEPILALDIDSRNMFALLYNPAYPFDGQSMFSLPSPELSLVRRIRAATETRQDIYLHGTALGGHFAAAVLRHARAGLGVTLHPHTADGMSKAPDNLSRLGLTVSFTCPPEALAIECAEFDPEFWSSVLSMAGLAEPTAIVVSARDGGIPLEELTNFLPDIDCGEEIYIPSSRFHTDRCRRRFYENSVAGPHVDDFFFTEAPLHLLRLSAIQRKTGGPVVDTNGALMFAMLADPNIRRRNWEEGVLAVKAVHTRIFAALLFQDRCCGVLEQRIPAKDEDLDLTALMAELDDFRMGRLTPEGLALKDGRVCALEEMPPEAEGFRPIYVVGSRSHLLRNLGHLCSASGSGTLPICKGLLYGYDQMLGARSGN